MMKPNTPDAFCLLRAKGVYNTPKEDYGGDGLLISGNKILAVGSFSELSAAYSDAHVEDYSDCYLLPGLINTHVHLEFDPTTDTLGSYKADGEYVNFLRAARHANAALRSGVTTLRDAGSSWRLLSLATDAAAELYPLPRMQLAGPPLTVTGGHLHFLGGEADSLDELIKSAREHHKRGCGALKLVASGGQLTPGSRPERESYDEKLLAAVSKEAHRLGMTTLAHCLTTQSIVNAMRGGIQCIEHMACFVRNSENGLLARIYVPQAMEEFRGDSRWFMIGITNNYHLLDHCRGNESRASAKESFLLRQEEAECEIFRRCIELGMRPVIGTDAGCGLTFFGETWLECAVLVERCGLTPHEAIRAATLSAADCLGLAEETGLLAAGYSADIIALPDDPIKDIHALKKVAHVICRGQKIV